MTQKEYLSPFIYRANKAAESVGKTVYFQINTCRGVWKLQDEESGKWHMEGTVREVGAYLLGYAKALESLGGQK